MAFISASKVFDSQAVPRSFTLLRAGLYEGLAGIVVRPRQAYSEGWQACGKGVALGVVGLVTKPVAGLLDLASLTAEGNYVRACVCCCTHTPCFPANRSAKRRKDPCRSQAAASASLRPRGWCTAALFRVGGFRATRPGNTEIHAFQTR